MQQNASLVTMLEQPCIITRLGNELREAAREFRESPTLFMRGTFSREQSAERLGTMRLGLSVGLLVYAAAFLILLLAWQTNSRQFAASRGIDIPDGHTPIYVPYIELATGGERSRGGGGGGRESNNPASVGHLPAPSLDPIVGPIPEAPIRPPVLPIIEAVKLDPRIQIERDDLIPAGVPDGASDLLSAGPGKNGGIGTGLNGGIGPGDGPGVGPGRNGGLGGGVFHFGETPGPAFQAQPPVDARPILLNHPRPFYTEQARKNKVQGVVKVRILVDETGAVREVLVTRGLPDGLTEQAIRAAHQMRFTPAMKDGRPLAYWISAVEVEFNLR